MGGSGQLSARCMRTELEGHPLCRAQVSAKERPGRISRWSLQRKSCSLAAPVDSSKSEGNGDDTERRRSSKKPMLDPVLPSEDSL